MLPVGSLLDYDFAAGTLTLRTAGAQLSLRFLAPDLLRITLLPEGRQMRPSVAVLPRQWDDVQVRLDEGEEALRLATPAMTVEVGRDPVRLRFYGRDGRLLAGEASLSWGEGAVAWEQVAPPEVRYYGFGQKPGFLDRRGRAMTHWATDESLHTPDHDALYQAIPFHIGMEGGRAHGLFVDSTARVRYDVAKERADRLRILADDDYLDAYLFAGPAIKDVLARYTELTGRMELPPLWALGYHQCRYTYFPEARVREVAAELRRREIPCDAVWLDIDYMDGYRVFTWDRERFPDPKQMVADLREQGFRTVTIVDPGVKVDARYPVFREGVAGNHFICHADGELCIDNVWPGRSAFPDFTRAATRRWWGDLHREFVNDLGIAGIWNDMNEPAVFNERKTLPPTAVQGEDGARVGHDRVHNAYGLLMAQATHEGLRRLQPDRRPFLLTRSGYAGIQRYAAVWMGDNHSWWEHLLTTVPILLGMGLSGVPFVGTDIGGFQGDCDGELFARWVQLGAFLPFCRNHAAMGTVDQEPWAFGPEVEEIARRYIQLRYRLLPFLYNEFYKSSQTGLPVMRPLLLEYPDDPETANLSDQFLLGEDLLVCPVYQPGATARMVYLPAGEWVDFWTGARHRGPARIVAEAPLERMPLYVRAGAILPMGPVRQWTDQPAPAELTLQVYAGADGALDLYEDEGEGYAYRDGGYAITPVRLSGTRLRIGAPEGGYRPTRDRLVVRFFAPGRVVAAERDGRPVTFRTAADGAAEVVLTEGTTDACELSFRVEG
ncbi:glycoside hydrolase family 31 protein [Symbiobacterium terraclitae]|uniref:glycoside hydrolase family 31 protein n=1 Tax=Symbiobacterium terraclitae TaxID=557451 RepID=UPI0035B5563E